MTPHPLSIGPVAQWLGRCSRLAETGIRLLAGSTVLFLNVLSVRLISSSGRLLESGVLVVCQILYHANNVASPLIPFPTYVKMPTIKP